MPRVKTPQERWGLYASLGIELAKHVYKARYSRFNLDPDLTKMLIRVAASPAILTSPKRHADDVLAFHRAYARTPDAVLGCLTFLRKTIADWKKYPAGFARLFLRQHALRWSTSKNGQPVPVSSMTAQELADYLTPIAVFPISDQDVKKARQQIVKEDRDFGIFERPEVQQYFRDGLTPELKRQLQGLTKGRKRTARAAATA